MLCALGLDSIEGHLHLLCIFIYRLLDLLAEVAVQFIPAFGFLWQIILFPLWYISFYQFEPQFVIVLHYVGRLYFEGALKEETYVS